MLLQLVPPRLVSARLFIPSDGMREERMQDLRNSIVGAIPYAAAWPGPFRGLKKKMISRNFWFVGPNSQAENSLALIPSLALIKAVWRCGHVGGFEV
jgi:hypothetical protein